MKNVLWAKQGMTWGKQQLIEFQFHELKNMDGPRGHMARPLLNMDYGIGEKKTPREEAVESLDLESMAMNQYVVHQHQSHLKKNMHRPHM